MIFRKIFSTCRIAQRNLYCYNLISLKYETETQSVHLTLNNSKKRNPLCSETLKELGSALDEIHHKIQTDKYKIMILRGEGPVFSAGHDLKQLKATKQPETIFNLCTKSLLALKKLPIITMSAIDGVAAAAGLQLALTCDIVLATQKSSFSTPGVKWGLFCSTPGVQLIRSINSQKKAAEMLLFGQSLTASEAYHYGLINKVVPNGQIEEQIRNYINKTKNLSGEVISLGKRVLEEQKSKKDLESAYGIASEGMCKNIKQKQDCKQGLNAFAQKRHPHFKN